MKICIMSIVLKLFQGYPRSQCCPIPIYKVDDEVMCFFLNSKKKEHFNNYRQLAKMGMDNYITISDRMPSLTSVTQHKN